MLDAAFGHGCQHCEEGIPVEKIKSKAGFIRLCLECVMKWFPGRAVEWWEARHAPMADHLSDKIEEMVQREFHRALSAAGLGH